MSLLRIPVRVNITRGGCRKNDPVFAMFVLPRESQISICFSLKNVWERIMGKDSLVVVLCSSKTLVNYPKAILYFKQWKNMLNSNSLKTLWCLVRGEIGLTKIGTLNYHSYTKWFSFPINSYHKPSTGAFESWKEHPCELKFPRV